MALISPTPPSGAVEAPEREYVDRLAARQAALTRWTGAHIALGNAKLAVAGGLVLIACLAFGAHWLSAWLLLFPIALFIPLARRHDVVLQQLRHAERAVAFYERGLRRLQDRWQGDGASGSRFLTRDHPYARDLDLFGSGSLFQLLCQARTGAGEACLANWLSAPASPEVIRARQAAVAELRPRLDLREEMSVLGEEIQAALEPKVMTQWSEAPPLSGLGRLRLLAGLLTAANFLALVPLLLGYGFWPILVALVVGQLVLRPYRPAIQRITISVQKPARSLALFARLLARLETEPFEAPLLREIAARLGLAANPSARVERLQRLCELLELRRSDLFAPIDAMLLWTFQMALAVEGWRAQHGAHLAQWLNAMGEMEALLSLAGYAYERPADPFSEIDETGVCYHGVEIGHPLIPAAQLVRNDVLLDPAHRVLIVSGSNMSGKSTYLRAVGVNAVLALAGAPVRARRLRLSVWQLGTSIQTVDSLQDGVSRFYAELLRLRQVVDLTSGAHPVLFLLDEILHGTNSHDRLIGAEALVRTLAQRGASGLVTTHDLALARIVADETLHAVNVHFADEIVDGKMTFDYRVHPGVVQQSNALALMRLVGLEV